MSDYNENINLDIYKYLYNRISVMSQNEIKNNKHMCCGIAYNVIKNLNSLIKYLNNEDYESYRILFSEIILNSSYRKLNNPNINFEGEYLDEKTIQNDFPEIYNKLNFYEFIISEFIESNYYNKLCEIINIQQIGEPILINRAKEVFTIIKINNNEFFVIDSHIYFHGKINRENLLNYILINKFYRGILSIAHFK